MKKLLFSLPLLLSVFCLNAQNTTISGRLTDASNGEVLIGATVEALGLAKGNVSNEYGFYSFTLPASEDSVTLRFGRLGYEAVFRTIKPAGTPIKLNVSLTQQGTVLAEVTIKANSLEEKVRSTEMSVTTLTAREAKALPALFR